MDSLWQLPHEGCPFISPEMCGEGWGGGAAGRAIFETQGAMLALYIDIYSVLGRVKSIYSIYRAGELVAVVGGSEVHEAEMWEPSRPTKFR